jgi:hypothetical protein
LSAELKVPLPSPFLAGTSPGLFIFFISFAMHGTSPPTPEGSVDQLYDYVVAFLFLLEEQQLPDFKAERKRQH